ncbi:hypothetical protein RFK57_01140 [Streptococcus suis]|uniref:hypothetical protein n=1 Tax=Streptococcus suis TaxID=1307 RepID=UPI002FC70BA1
MKVLKKLSSRNSSLLRENIEERLLLLDKQKSNFELVSMLFIWISFVLDFLVENTYLEVIFLTITIFLWCEVLRQVRLRMTLLLNSVRPENFSYPQPKMLELYKKVLNHFLKQFEFRDLSKILVEYHLSVVLQLKAVGVFLNGKSNNEFISIAVISLFQVIFLFFGKKSASMLLFALFEIIQVAILSILIYNSRLFLPMLVIIIQFLRITFNLFCLKLSKGGSNL